VAPDVSGAYISAPSFRPGRTKPPGAQSAPPQRLDPAAATNFSGKGGVGGAPPPPQQSTSFGMHKLLAPMEYFSPKPFCTPLTVHWSQLAGSERPLNWPIANLFQIPACQQSPSPVLQNTRHFCPTVHTPTLKTEFWSPGSACEVVQQPKGISKPRRPLCCLYSCCTRHTEPPHRPLPFPILHREALQYNCMA